MAKTRTAVEMTNAWLKSVPIPETGRVDHFDQKVRGLGLRVSATGHRAWFLMYRKRSDPKLRRLTLGTYPALGLADARAAAQEAITAIAKGGDPAQDKQDLKAAPTVKELAEDYLDKYAKPKKRSWKRDAQILKANVVPAWGSRKIHDVRRRDVIALLDSIVTAGAPIQANRTLALIRKMFNWAISRDLIEANPCTQVKAPAAENQRDRVLSEDEIRLLWAALDGQATDIAAIFRLQLMTAQRIGEVLQMRWDAIDLASAWWTIPKEGSKNKLSHRVPLAPMALEILESLPRHSDWVFPSPRPGKPIANIYKARERVTKASGVEFVPHDLRRTAASLMASLGTDPRIIAKILNHVEPGVTKVYNRHSYDREKMAALHQWAIRLAEIANTGTTNTAQF